ncbi:MAG: ribbon-helix-helix protein, CopG family [Deltaproteobacteria bacterium]|nr:ribbon-helix-helix protein, CopG family [Deltaproteobacteria bacterium]
MMPAIKRKLPTFANDREEAKFWAAHSVEEFAGELQDLDVQIRPARSEQIALRLYKEDLETLKKLAERRGIGHTTLIRSIVEQWLARLRTRTGRGRSGRCTYSMRNMG